MQASHLRPATLLKKRLWHRCFPVNFVKFLRTAFLQNTSVRLLLFMVLIPWSICSDNIFNQGIIFNKYFLLLFSWHLSDFVFFCKVIIISWYFIFSCDLFVAISLVVISSSFELLGFIPAIFLLPFYFDGSHDWASKFHYLIKYCFYYFLCLFLISCFNSWFFFLSWMYFSYSLWSF